MALGDRFGRDVNPNIQTRPEHKPLSDAAILLMPTLEVLETYYTYPKFDQSVKDPKCTVHIPHPVWTEPLRSAAAALGIEKQIRNRIYHLREDLWFITDSAGKKTRGLVNLSHLDLRVIQCERGTDTVGEVFKYVFLALGALIPFTWPIIIAQLALTAYQMTTAIEEARKNAGLLERVTLGVNAIVQRENLALAEAYGLFPNNPISYAAAIRIPTSRAAWKLAIALGLPHPAVLLPADAPRTVANQMAELKRFLIRVHLVRRWLLQIRLEETLRSKIEHVEWDIVNLPERSPDVVTIDKSYLRGKPQGIAPRITKTADGLFLTTVKTLDCDRQQIQMPGGWIDYKCDNRRWLQPRKIKINGGAAFSVIREYLAWLDNPNIYDPAVTAWLKAALTDRAAETFVADVPPADVVNEIGILTSGTAMPARGSYSPAGYVNPASAGIGPGALLNQFTGTLSTGTATQTPGVPARRVSAGGPALLILLAALGLWWLSEKQK